MTWLGCGFDESSNEWKMRADEHGRPIFQSRQPPEILFIERCVQLLDGGGRMAIVLPNGILNNPASGMSGNGFVKILKYSLL